MNLMPGTSLKDLDTTDIDTLFPWYLWKIHSSKNKANDDVVYRDGKPYRRVDPKNATWLRK